MTEQLREDSKNAYQEKKVERRVENNERANEKLKREIEEERIKLQNQYRPHVISKIPDEEPSQKFEFKEPERELKPIQRKAAPKVITPTKKIVRKSKPTPRATKPKPVIRKVKPIVKPKFSPVVKKSKPVKKVKISKVEKTNQEPITESVQFHRSRALTPETEAAELGEIFDTLYIYADVKRIKVFEWKDGKKRVALNKERELRRTHAGGFSQEKFQRFIDMKKKKSWDWIEDNLTRQGILRPPFEKVVIDCNDEILKEKITNKIAQLE